MTVPATQNIIERGGGGRQAIVLRVGPRVHLTNRANMHPMGLAWTLSLALVGQGACFQLAGSPVGRIDSSSRWRTTHFSRGVRLLHLREAASVVRSDSGESGGSGQAGGGGRGGEGGGEEERGACPVLMDFFVRCVDPVLLFALIAGSAVGVC